MIEWSEFKHPQRYLNKEWNAVKKNHTNKIKICLCYPDLYEIGMSNLGLRIIYGLLNSFSDVVCERCFMPDDDFSNYLWQNNIKLFSLETRTPLDEFDIVGFNFNYELNYTNFLHMLRLANIPLFSRERSKNIVIGGGVANPEPLCDFVDVFLIGEFEAVVDNFIEVLRKSKGDKELILAGLAEQEGFYIPKFYNVYKEGKKYVVEKLYRYSSATVKKVFVRDLNRSFYPVRWLTPYTEIIHDRAQIEITRGCPHRCYFCQARCMYFPYRQRKPDRVVDLAREIYDNSGYESFSLLSLSASDYTYLDEVINQIGDMFENKVHLSLPSLRINHIINLIPQKMKIFKKISLTVAIEAATAELRKKINKDIDVTQLLEAVKILRDLKIRHIKLYFMFGFPEEKDNDLVEIGRVIYEIQRLGKIGVHVSINAFIPKPFTYFEKVSMVKEEELVRRKKVILRNIRRSGDIKVKISNIKKSILEAIISRADREFGKVIYAAYKKGARFDAHQHRFNWQIWDSVMNEQGLDYNNFISSFEDSYPWQHIRMV